MLLRRMIENVRSQNWIAVGLDFGIVVIGVFLGLQVQQWSEERARDQRESVFIQRLHGEVVDLEATRRPLITLREGWNRQLQSATDVLFGADDRALTTEECRAIGFSYAITNPTDDLASLIELQSSGALSTLRDARVSEALQAYLLQRARARDANAGIMASAEVLAAAHPELIRVAVPTRVEPTIEPATYVCDTDGMRIEQGFLNRFELMQSNFGLHVSLNRDVSNGLADLHGVIDEVLGVSHAP